MVTTTRAALVLAFTLSLFMMGILLVWGMGSYEMIYLQEPVAKLSIGSQYYPIHLGQMSLAVPLLVLCLYSLNLIAEFFGFGFAVFSTWAASLAVVVFWSLLNAFEFFPFMEGTADISHMQHMLFDLSPVSLIVFLTKINASLFVFALVYELWRRFTRNTFYLVRSFMAHLIGLALMAGVYVAAQEFPSFDEGVILSAGLTQFVQMFALYFVLLPLHYFIKWPIEAFVGSRQRQAINSCYRKAPVETLVVAPVVAEPPVSVAPVIQSPVAFVPPPIPVDSETSVSENPFHKVGISS